MTTKAGTLRATSLAALAFAPAVSAQSPQWQVPPAGAVQYDRTTRVHVAPPEDVGHRGRRIVPAGNAAWRVHPVDRSAGPAFAQPEFDDAAWTAARTPLDTRDPEPAWPETRRWLDARIRFDLGSHTPRTAVLTVQHDDGCTIWLNGREIYRKNTVAPDLRQVTLTDGDLAAFVRGANVLAAEVENTGGPGHLDVGLTVFDRPLPDADAAASLVAASQDAARRLENDLFPDFHSPGYLCEGELDADHERLKLAPIDLRDLGAWLAFDLRDALDSGVVTGEIPRSWRFGDLQLRGKTNPPASDGTQRIEVSITSKEPAERGDDRRFVRRWVVPQHTHSIDGSLVVVRRFDPDQGIVVSATTRLEATLRALHGQHTDTPFTLRLDDEWRFRRIRENRDVDFGQAVTQAIRRAGAWISGRVADTDRRELRAGVHGNRTYETGRLALALLAMVHAEIPHDDPVLRTGFDELRRRELVDTYSTAHAIMALEAYYAPRGEIEDLRAGIIDRPHQRRPSAADLALLEHWKDVLLRNVDSRVDEGYLLRFNYVAGPRFDNSVDQYGLLGLYSAHLCGVDISPTVWNAAAKHLLDVQAAPTGTRDLTLTSYRQLDELRAGHTTTVAPRATKVAGWGYQEPKTEGAELPIYGSMTCAGIAGLTICLAGLRDANVTRAQLSGSADRAVRQGFAWLAENFTVHWNPGRVHQPFYWVYYYLYGLERACELSGVARIDGRDWYYEGALTLLDQQNADGSWPKDAAFDDQLEQTAMALLFLKQASLPVYTGK